MLSTNRFALPCPKLMAVLFLLGMAVMFAPPAIAASQNSDREDNQNTAGHENVSVPVNDQTQTNAQNLGADQDVSATLAAAETTPNDGPKDSKEEEKKPGLISNDAIIFGILMMMLGFVFWSSGSSIGFFQKFYKFVPMLLMCYFLPSLLTLFGIVNPDLSNLYFIASRYLLPASLILLTLSIDLGEVVRLGPKALIMFVVGTIGVIIGGPLAILLVSLINPEWVGGAGPDAIWRGLTTVAGSWIGGGANQLAMKEVFEVGEGIYPAMVAVDILVAEFWMVFLLLGVGKAESIDRLLKADASSIERLKEKMEKFSASTSRIATATDLVVIGAIAFGATAFSHLMADTLAPYLGALAEEQSQWAWLKDFSLHKDFFWIVVTATTLGIGMSFTPLRNYEGVGASKMGTVFIFILVAVIGMKMDVMAVVKYKELFLVGLIWMLIHVFLLIFTAWLIRAPYFFLAVGSKANIGGAASAPVVAAAFHPSLAPVGVLLAVLGYALGTYGAMLCGWLMEFAAP